MSLFGVTLKARNIIVDIFSELNCHAVPVDVCFVNPLLQKLCLTTSQGKVVGRREFSVTTLPFFDFIDLISLHTN